MLQLELVLFVTFGIINGLVALIVVMMLRTLLVSDLAQAAGQQVQTAWRATITMSGLSSADRRESYMVEDDDMTGPIQVSLDARSPPNDKAYDDLELGLPEMDDSSGMRLAGSEQMEETEQSVGMLPPPAEASSSVGGSELGDSQGFVDHGGRKSVTFAKQKRQA
eukprot:TRINITY_DN44057_c0_g1_i1.p1 TRINITY_DN44057_c0_g1~~TRINITY_DN44057_c0_g1_i1.p1  ORF type:complete len:165 (-),score=39.81 TRINITY_DN44057_c0_g1_i1:196-690(-)